MRLRAAPEAVRERENHIEAMLANGELSAKNICLRLGFEWPAQLEKARATLISMEKEGRLVKTVRPTRETREAYYALPKSAPTFSATHNSGEGLPSSDAAEVGADTRQRAL